jgi:hypothetical protein
VESARLEAVTQRGSVRVGTVRTPLGPLVIARVEGGAEPGADVRVSTDAGIPVVDI